MANATVSAKPAGLDIELYSGDDFSMPIQLKSGNPAVGIDLTGWTFLAQIRSRESDNELLGTFTCTPADQSESDNLGIVILSISAEDSADLSIGSRGAQWDLQGTSDAGKVRTYLAGEVSILAEVSVPEGD